MKNLNIAKFDKLEKAMTKRTTSKLAVFAAFCAGVALGIWMSPAKNGFGCNSGNTTHYHYHDKPDTEAVECGCAEEDV